MFGCSCKTNKRCGTHAPSALLRQSSLGRACWSTVRGAGYASNVPAATARDKYQIGLAASGYEPLALTLVESEAIGPMTLTAIKPINPPRIMIMTGSMIELSESMTASTSSS